MSRSKLLKAALLGLCMSAFVTNTAFAKMVTPVKGVDPSANVTSDMGAGVNGTTASGVTTSVAALTEDQIALYEKQKEVDQYVFSDHAREIEEKGFTVYSTFVEDNVVVICIVPYTKENADYLYKALGTKSIKIVEGDISIIYASGVAGSDVGSTDVPAAGIDGSVVDMLEDAVSLGAPDAIDSNPVYKGEDTIGAVGEETMQLEATSEVVNAEDDVLMYITSDESQSPEDMKALAAADGLAALTGDTDKKSDNLAKALPAFALAGGIIIIGGAGMALGRKRMNK